MIITGVFLFIYQNFLKIVQLGFSGNLDREAVGLTTCDGFVAQAERWVIGAITTTIAVIFLVLGLAMNSVRCHCSHEIAGARSGTIHIPTRTKRNKYARIVGQREIHCIIVLFLSTVLHVLTCRQIRSRSRPCHRSQIRNLKTKPNN